MTNTPSLKKIRLHKFLAECGVASRRGAEKIIQLGKVKVNDQVVSELGVSIDPYQDKVTVNNNLVKPLPRGIVLLNKPTAVVTTKQDPHGRRCVADLIPEKYQSYVPVGRLDYDSCGLIIMTNDGDLADRLMHPRYGCEKVYQVKVEGRVEDHNLAKLERGVRLDDGMAKAKIKLLADKADSTLLEVRIGEGRNRIIRRMMDFIGHPVIELKRVGQGPFKLAGLKPGEIRVLPEKEYRRVRQEVMGLERM